MFRLAAVANFLIRSFFIFLIVFLWASYFMSSFLMTFLVAILVTCLANYLWMLWAYRRRRAKNLSRVSQQRIAKIMLQFKFMTSAATLAFFGRVFEAKAMHNRIVVERGGVRYNFFPLFHVEPTQETIIACLQKCGVGEKCVVAAHAFDGADRAFFESLDVDVVFMDGARVYDELLEPKKLFPKTLVTEKASVRLTLRRLGALVFSRKKVKSYIFVGVVVLLTSLIIRPSLFYIIMTTIIFGMALISFLRPSLGTREKVFG